MAPKVRDPDKEKDDRDKQNAADKLEREKAQADVEEARVVKREIRDREERLRPERVEKGQRPRNPRPGQLIHDVKERKYLRFDVTEVKWDEVERHRVCDHWIKRGDPIELHVHECVNNQTSTVVFQCQVCQSKYRIKRSEAEFFRNNHNNECPTCQTPYPEDQPRDAIEKDFR